MRTKGRRAQDTKIECVRNILDLQYTNAQTKKKKKTPTRIRQTLTLLGSVASVPSSMIPSESAPSTKVEIFFKSDHSQRGQAKNQHQNFTVFNRSAYIMGNGLGTQVLNTEVLPIFDQEQNLTGVAGSCLIIGSLSNESVSLHPNRYPNSLKSDGICS